METAMNYCVRYHRLDVDGVNVVCAEGEAYHPQEDISLCGSCERGHCLMHIDADDALDDPGDDETD